MLPLSGSVLGVDVGGSLTRKSTAICRLSWTPDAFSWTIGRSTADPLSRAANITRVASAHEILVAAVDGPLAAGFAQINRYRAAERMLTRRLGQKIGKPGTSNVPVGRALNEQANACAQDVLALNLLRPAMHAEAIDASAIVEAFPSTFMGLLLADPASVPTIRGDRSDRYFSHLANNGRIRALLATFLPGRQAASSPRDISHHDDRTSLICAITALCVAAGDYCAVGDEDGWIILPPFRFIAPWASAILKANEEPDFKGRFVIRNQALPSGLSH